MSGAEWTPLALVGGQFVERSPVLLRHEFEAWLQGRPADEPFVGVAAPIHATDFHPVLTYLDCTWGGTWHNVDEEPGARLLLVDDHGGVCRAPWWIKRFDRAVHESCAAWRPITAQTCLAVLATVPAQP